MKLRYYLNFIKRKYIIAFKEIQEYKLNFILFLLTFFFDFILLILFWKILFLKSTTLNGWNYQGIVGLLLFLQVFWILNNVFLAGIKRGYRQILNGNFDYFLIYPITPIMNLIFYRVTLMSIFSNLLILIFLFFFYISNFGFRIYDLIISFIFAILGNIIFALFIFILDTLIFWIKDNKFSNSILVIINRLLRYPLDITNRILHFIFLSFFPIIFLNTIPSKILQGVFNIDWIFNILVLIFILFVIATLIWKKGVKLYESGMG